MIKKREYGMLDNIDWYRKRMSQVFTGVRSTINKTYTLIVHVFVPEATYFITMN